MSNIHLVLVGNYLRDRQESMERFAQILVSELPQHDITVQLMQPQLVFARWGAPHHGFGKWLGYVDKNLIFPQRLGRIVKKLRLEHGKRLRAHVCDHSNAVYLPCFTGLNATITCHDLLAVRAARGEIPQHRVGTTGKKLQKWIAESMKKAAHIACVSRSTMMDVQRISKAHSDRLSVIYNGLNHPFRQIPQLEALRLVQKEAPLHAELFSRPFILHVGGNPWYKNRGGVLHIYEQLTRIHSDAPSLIMAGKPLPADLLQIKNSMSSARNVLTLPDLSNDAVMALYNLAELLLFPSFEEGFGWPILEAQACGCPVVTTRKAPMTEVGAEAARYLDPGDVKQSAEVLRRVLSDRVEMETMKACGLENAKNFTTERMITSYARLFSEKRQVPVCAE